MSGGRPSEYDKIGGELVCEQTFKLCLLGATDREIANFFRVSEQTINSWKSNYPEFLESLKEGKLQADAKVADRLFQRALGYTHAEEKIFQHAGEIIRAETLKHYPPDTTAAIFWLKNRRAAEWRDKHEVEVNHKRDAADWTREELLAVANAANGSERNSEENGRDGTTDSVH